MTTTPTTPTTCPDCGGPIPSAFPQADRDGKCYSCADLDMIDEMDEGTDPEHDIF